MKALELKNTTPDSGAYYLNGNDSFWLKTAEDTFRAILPKDSFSLFVIDRLQDVTQIDSSLNVFNFDGTPNVVIVKDADTKSSDVDHSKLTNLLKNGVSPNYLVFCNVEFLNAAEKKLLIEVDCNKIDKYGCQKYVKSLFPNGIDSNACSLLIDYTDCDMAKINNETFKLLNYCENKKVTYEDVELLVTEDSEVQSFTFANNILSKKYTLALKQLEKLQSQGSSPAWILATLISQFQRMLNCALSPLSDEELASILGVKPYAIKKTRETTNFNKTQLRDMLDTLSSYEYKFRTGEMSDSTALNCAITKLLTKEL